MHRPDDEVGKQETKIVMDIKKLISFELQKRFVIEESFIGLNIY